MKRNFLLVLSIFVLSSCTLPLGQLDQSNQTIQNTATLRIVLPEGYRTIMPDVTNAIQSFRLTLTSNSGFEDTIIQNAPFPDSGATFSEISFGEYQLEVEAFSAADAGGMMVANNGGGQTITIDSADLTVEAIIAFLLTGVGDLEITFSFPINLGIDRVSVSWNGGVESDLTLVSGTTEITGVFALSEETAANNHSILARFYTGETQIGSSAEQIVWIYNGITTTYLWELDSDDFVSAPDAPTGISAVGFSGGALVSWVDNSLFEESYVLERKLSGESTWTRLNLDIPANSTSVVDDSFPFAMMDKVDYRIAAVNARGTSSFDILAVSLNTTGYVHPTSGAFSPVDLNGASNGWGWDSESWDVGMDYVASGGSNVQFGVFSTTATRILLEIYDEKQQSNALYEYWMEKGADDIWRAEVSSIPDRTYFYAFRAWGPNWSWSEDWLRGNSNAGFIADYTTPTTGNTTFDENVIYRHNPNKLLHDPYAKEISHDTETPEMLDAGHNGGMYGTGGEDLESTYPSLGSMTYQGVDRRNYDTGPWAPKGVIFDPGTTSFSKPNRPIEESIIYESHVRGITQHASSSSLGDILSGITGFEEVVNIPAEYRGTYRGAGMLAPYIKAIGINTIEFLPIHETKNDTNDYDLSTPGDNYWGYMTFGFFAPDRHYSYDKSPGGPTQEFREMVQAFHAEGIEVYLDVVYNHTGEGGNWGAPELTGFTSFGGFDSSYYYHSVPGDAGSISDGATGVGNQLNYSFDGSVHNGPTITTTSGLTFSTGRTMNHKLVIDSLHYWIDEMGVDGFRFDLAAVMGRDPDRHLSGSNYWDNAKAFYQSHPLITGMADLGQNYDAEMVAEPWDLWGWPYAYYPEGWAEWNGKQRDEFRRYMKGDGNETAFHFFFNGAYDDFADTGGPTSTVNFLVAHDGLNMTDLVSYSINDEGTRDFFNTQDWPFGPSDGGTSGNNSWDSGSDQNLRRQRLRNFWLSLMFSRGVPMIVYGDEINRTQNGNNNPYNLDSVVTWNHYGMIDSDAPQGVVLDPAGQSGGTEPMHNNLGTDSNTNGLNDLFFFAADVMNRRNSDSALHFSDYSTEITFSEPDGSTSDSRATRIAINANQGTTGGSYLLLINMNDTAVDFDIWSPGSDARWIKIYDTAHDLEIHGNKWSAEQYGTLSGDATPSGGFQWADATGAATYYDFGVPGWSITVLEKVPALNSPPSATSVGINGDLQPGQNITGTYTYEDDFNDPEGTSIFRWLIADTSGGTYTAIPGATSLTYSIQLADEGKWLKFEVTPRAASGNTNLGSPYESSAVQVAGEDVTLASLISSLGTLSPAFDPTVLSYDLFLDNATAVSFTPTAGDPSGATIEVNSLSVSSGVSSSAITLATAASGTITSEELTTIPIVVTNGGFERTYEISVYRSDFLNIHFRAPGWTGVGSGDIEYNSNGPVVGLTNMGVVDGNGWNNITIPVNDHTAAISFRFKFWQEDPVDTWSDWFVYYDSSYSWFNSSTPSGHIWVDALGGVTYFDQDTGTAPVSKFGYTTSITTGASAP